MTLSGVREAVALTMRTSGNRHFDSAFLFSTLLIQLNRMDVIHAGPRDLHTARSLPRTHEKIIGLLFQVIWEIPEELRRELSRLGSKSTLR